MTVELVSAITAAFEDEKACEPKGSLDCAIEDAKRLGFFVHTYLNSDVSRLFWIPRGRLPTTFEFLSE